MWVFGHVQSGEDEADSSCQVEQLVIVVEGTPRVNAIKEVSKVVDESLVAICELFGPPLKHFLSLNNQLRDSHLKFILGLFDYFCVQRIKGLFLQDFSVLL